MKFKWQFWTGWTFAAVVLTYCVLAYIFMWAPIVTYQNDTTDVCVNNLIQIDAAISQFALEQHKHTGDSVVFEDITPYIKLNSQGEIPRCPAGGKYSVTAVGIPPTCSLGTNPLVKVHGDGLTWHYLHGEGSLHRLP